MNEPFGNSEQLQGEQHGAGEVLDVRAAYAIATRWRKQASEHTAGRAALIRCAEEHEAALAARQLVAAKDVPELFVQWLEREMPAGTIIGKPAWWAPKLTRALRSAERGVLGNCNGN
ncbi:hypothetical protein NC00_01460 [Xanthomonas cannabis pv. phaseoli]|uniref:Uncharacterized protein n=1 Tax=Xanthomonas cannabis pv. phaseoli TaxID=1885902 RepID=A0AB34PEP7_9XANT|nr:hypothetical protein [Xanthomonas cannabis]KGK59611.1 hypothetical protein NC00_01460 [Xanthomonas cannabis pv. phaseoli]